MSGLEECINEDPPLTYVTIGCAAICLIATPIGLPVLGAALLTAISLGFLAATFGAVWGWLWARGT